LSVLWHLLLALAGIVAVGKVLAEILRRAGQPPVIGEIVAGILLGPSLLGRVAPGAFAYLFPADITPALTTIAQIGVVLYMFVVGLDLDLDALRGQLRSTVAISTASTALPFALGCVLASYLYPRLSTPTVPFTHFTLFLGVAMSVTAFPVLARILAHFGMTRTPLGALALTSAAINDVTAWCLLALIVGVVRATDQSAIGVVILTIAFAMVIFIAVGPLMRRIATSATAGRPTPAALVVTLLTLAASAAITESIGIHAVFGAFLFGAVVPHKSDLARYLERALENLVTALMLPAFFALTGLRTEIGLLSTVSNWLVCALLITVATCGKFGGATLAGRASGLRWRQAAALGVLMNTRGLMELIVLNVGLDLGVISPTVFTMLVVMALVTTIATSPVLAYLGVQER